jgi:hypothetical protein
VPSSLALVAAFCSLNAVCDATTAKFPKSPVGSASNPYREDMTERQEKGLRRDKKVSFSPETPKFFPESSSEKTSEDYGDVTVHISPDEDIVSVKDASLISDLVNKSFQPVLLSGGDPESYARGVPQWMANLQVDDERAPIMASEEQLKLHVEEIVPMIKEFEIAFVKSAKKFAVAELADPENGNAVLKAKFKKSHANLVDACKRALEKSQDVLSSHEQWLLMNADGLDSALSSSFATRELGLLGLVGRYSACVAFAHDNWAHPGRLLVEEEQEAELAVVGMPSFLSPKSTSHKRRNVPNSSSSKSAKAIMPAIDERQSEDEDSSNRKQRSLNFLDIDSTSNLTTGNSLSPREEEDAVVIQSPPSSPQRSNKADSDRALQLSPEWAGTEIDKFTQVAAEAAKDAARSYEKGFAYVDWLKYKEMNAPLPTLALAEGYQALAARFAERFSVSKDHLVNLLATALRAARKVSAPETLVVPRKLNRKVAKVLSKDY